MQYQDKSSIQGIKLIISTRGPKSSLNTPFPKTTTICEVMSVFLLLIRRQNKQKLVISILRQNKDLFSDKSTTEVNLNNMKDENVKYYLMILDGNFDGFVVLAWLVYDTATCLCDTSRTNTLMLIALTFGPKKHSLFLWTFDSIANVPTISISSRWGKILNKIVSQHDPLIVLTPPEESNRCTIKILDYMAYPTTFPSYVT